jgi:hypothetical protein
MLYKNNIFHKSNLKNRILQIFSHSFSHQTKIGHLFLSIFENGGKPMTQKLNKNGPYHKKFLCSGSDFSLKIL